MSARRFLLLRPGLLYKSGERPVLIERYSRKQEDRDQQQYEYKIRVLLLESSECDFTYFFHTLPLVRIDPTGTDGLVFYVKPESIHIHFTHIFFSVQDLRQYRTRVHVMPS